MPKKFEFKVDGVVKFDCQLSSRQCTAHVKSGAQCRRRCVIGLPVCWMHLASDHHLKIKRSNIPNTNMQGLFAWDPKAAGQPVFKKGNQIIKYEGQTLTEEQKNNRYGPYTAPYGMHINKNKSVDAACQRSAAALINHSAKASACNCEFSLYARGGVVNVKAIKNIAHDTELLVDYGLDYELEEEGVSHRTK